MIGRECLKITQDQNQKPKRSRDHRENPARAIFITRDIDYSLFKELLPEIISLRGKSSRSISVYIDSFGGEVLFANLLTNLIRCPNQDGASCKMVTVAAGYVASCAADMLALGDYAIAYPYAQIHYHGTRQKDDEITLEKIPFIAASLRATNEQYAFRLAARMFRRMVFHIAMMATQTTNPSDLIGPVQLFDAKQMPSCIGYLKEKLKSQPELLKLTASKQEKFTKLVESLRPRDGATGSIVDVSDQGGLLKHLIDLEMRSNPGQELMNILPMIEEDYAQIRDFFFGMYQRNMKGIIGSSGTVFLTPEESEQLLIEEQKGKKERFNFLVNTVSPRLEPLWFFVVSLCRSLQEGEYPMTPEEAYWAGLVDEVVGKNLPCVRKQIESVMASASAPVQPSSQSETVSSEKVIQP